MADTPPRSPITTPSSVSFDARFKGAREGSEADPGADPGALIPWGSSGRGKSPLARICSTNAGTEVAVSVAWLEAGDGRTSPVGTDKASAITPLMMWATKNVAHRT